MPYDIIIGRDAADKETFGNRGLAYLGKGYVRMGTYTSLSNKLWLDVARSHVILVAGKRGTGKSYSIAAIAEELSCLPEENAKNIASLIFDTMGIFWTMKFPNEKEHDLLASWDLEEKPLPVKVFVPLGKAAIYREKGIPVDATFALNPTELAADDWLALFNVDITSREGVFITRVIESLKKQPFGFALDSIIHALSNDSEANKETKEVAAALFTAAESWGIFATDREGTNVSDLLNPGTTSVLDISIYSSTAAFNIRALVISLLSRKIFQHRMDARKQEEREAIRHGQDYLTLSQTGGRRQQPLVWLFLDEAHEFLPVQGKTPATDALVQLLREGRQPGISLVMATQQPGQIHKDAMSQSDIVIAHRVTSKADLAALNEIMQTYTLESIKQHMDSLPPLKGAAIVLDDNSERIYPMRVRPRFTWHGGESPVSIKADLLI
jgi:DNA polymerase III delta prime subunit